MTIKELKKILDNYDENSTIYIAGTDIEYINSCKDYVVLDVERGRKSDKQEVECAASFLKLVRGSQGKIDDSDLQRHKQPSGSREVSIDDNVNDEPLEF